MSPDDDHVQPRREPVFNVPAAVLAVLVLLVAIHAVRHWLTEEIDTWFVIAMAFVPARYSDAALAADLPGGEWARVTSFLTHTLVHGSLAHLILNGAWLLAFGSAICRRLDGKRFLLLSALSAVAGALMFLALNPGLLAPMVGASGAVAGLMGASLLFLFPALDAGGVRLLREAPQSVRALSLAEALRDRRVQIAVAVWLLLNAAASLGFGGAAEGGGIAWEAHIGGFIAGLLVFGWIDTAPPERNCEQPYGERDT